MSNIQDTAERNYEISLVGSENIPTGLLTKVNKIIDIVIDGSVGHTEEIAIQKVTIFEKFVNVTFVFPLDIVYSLNQNMNTDGWYVNWIQVMDGCFHVELYLDL